MKEKDLEGLFISSTVSHLFGNLVRFWCACEDLQYQ